MTKASLDTGASLSGSLEYDSEVWNEVSCFSDDMGVEPFQCANFATF